MNTQLASIAALSDTRLLAQVKHLAQHERQATATLVAHLAVLDERRLYLGEGCSSLFAYCTLVLHLSEGAAYSRIQAARAARRFPVVLEKLADGRLNLTTVRLLAPHLTEVNHIELLASAVHKSKRDVEDLVAELRPRPDAKALIRRLPATELPAAASPTTAPAVQRLDPAQAAPVLPPVPCQAPAPAVTPLAPERYRIQFTASAETHAKLRRAQDLLRHQIPDGDPSAVIDRALGVLITQLEKSKAGKVDQPRGERSRGTRAGEPRGVGPGRVASGRKPRTRHIPAAVRRAVWQRDDGRCAFIGLDGRRCDSRGFMEFHHVKPFAAGGEASVENVELRCRAHNQYEADLYFAGGKALRPSYVRERQALYDAYDVRRLGASVHWDELGVANWVRIQ
jgi:5-methylcytosine-specific restriction endonuclease McrA